MRSETGVVIKTIRIPFEMNQEILELSKQDGRSINSMLITMLKYSLKNRKEVI